MSVMATTKKNYFTLAAALVVASPFFLSGVSSAESHFPPDFNVPVDQPMLEVPATDVSPELPPVSAAGIVAAEVEAADARRIAVNNPSGYEVFVSSSIATFEGAEVEMSRGSVVISGDVDQVAGIASSLTGVLTYGDIEVEQVAEALEVARPSSTTNDAYIYDMLGLDVGWEHSTGNSSGDPIRIAILDQGVWDSSQFGDRLLPGYDAVFDMPTADVLAQGLYGDSLQYLTHGDPVAVAAAGDPYNGILGYGACFSCEVLPVQVFGEVDADSGQLTYPGSAWGFDIVDGIHYAIDNGADIINMSLGGSHRQGSSMQLALERAEEEGVVVLSSAGNNGGRGSGWPAAFPTVVSVGGVEADLSSADASNFSPVDVDVTASWVQRTAQANGSTWFAGTSQASPSAAGVFALVMDKFPELTPAEIRDRVFAFAVDSQQRVYDEASGKDVAVSKHGGVFAGTGLLDPTVPAPALTPAVVDAEDTYVVESGVNFYFWTSCSSALEDRGSEYVKPGLSGHAIASADVATTLFINGVPYGSYSYGAGDLVRMENHTYNSDTPYLNEGDVTTVEITSSTPGYLPLTMSHTCNYPENLPEVLPPMQAPAVTAGEITLECPENWVNDGSYSRDVTATNASATHFVEFRLETFYDGYDVEDMVAQQAVVGPGLTAEFFQETTLHLGMSPSGWRMYVRYPDFEAEGTGSDNPWFYVSYPDNVVYLDQEFRCAAEPDPTPEPETEPEPPSPEAPIEGIDIEDDVEDSDLNAPLVPIPGARLLDSRGPGTVDGKHGGEGNIPAGGVRYMQVAGRGGVPVEATAATLSVVAVGAKGNDGFMTIWPCADASSAVPNVSTLNFNDGWVRANTTTTALGPTGGVCVYSFTETGVVVDVQSYSTSSDLETVQPYRAYDSRDFSEFAAGEVRWIPVTSKDKKAAFVNITAVNSAGGDFASAYPCTSISDPVPNVSILNYVPGAAVANNSVITLNSGGFCLYSAGVSDLIVDVTGFLADDATGTAPINPVRFVDTRQGKVFAASNETSSARSRFQSGEVRMFAIAGSSPAISPDVRGVIANFTVVGPSASAFLTAWPCKSPFEKVPNTSMLNFDSSWAATPNTSVQQLSDSGTLCVYANQETDVIIDISAVLT